MMAGLASVGGMGAILFGRGESEGEARRPAGTIP
jgi:hypothetical protein